MLGVPDNQAWHIVLSCHCIDGVVIHAPAGPDLAKPWICPKCEEMAMPVSAVRWDERTRERIIAERLRRAESEQCSPAAT